MQDFFFKSINKKGETPLSDLAHYASLTTPSYFLNALNRYLKSSKQHRLIATCDTSHPSDFANVLSMLPQSGIGRVVIGSRTDIKTNVNATLDCRLWLSKGVLDVRPHWTAYKDIRAEEIMTTLVKPLFDQGLRSRTTLDFKEDESLLRCETLPVDNDEFVSRLFSLAQYPISYEERPSFSALLCNLSN